MKQYFSGDEAFAAGIRLARPEGGEPPLASFDKLFVSYFADRNGACKQSPKAISFRF